MRRAYDALNEILPREVLRAGLAHRTLAHWNEIVGPILSQQSAPERFDHGVLWVKVSGSEWSQEMRMQSELILSRLNEKSGEKYLFTQIRFGVRGIPKSISSVDVVQESEEVDLSELSIREIAERRLKRLHPEQ